MRTLFRIMAFSGVLILAPFALAMQNTSSKPHKGIDGRFIPTDNLCNPEFDVDFDQVEFEQVSIPLSLDSEQLERVKIELVKRGFSPRFDPGLDSGIDLQLMEAVALFSVRVPSSGNGTD